MFTTPSSLHSSLVATVIDFICLRDFLSRGFESCIVFCILEFSTVCRVVLNCAVIYFDFAISSDSIYNLKSTVL